MAKNYESYDGSYNCAVAGYAASLADRGVSPEKTQLAAEILKGEYVNGSRWTRGAKTYFFNDGTKQEVHTYAGRMKAVSKILGLNSKRDFLALNNLVNCNAYLNENSRAYGLKRNLVELRRQYSGKLERATKAEAIERANPESARTENRSFWHLLGKYRAPAAAAASIALLAGSYGLTALTSGCSGCSKRKDAGKANPAAAHATNSTINPAKTNLAAKAYAPSSSVPADAAFRRMPETLPAPAAVVTNLATQVLKSPIVPAKVSPTQDVLKAAAPGKIKEEERAKPEQFSIVSAITNNLSWFGKNADIFPSAELRASKAGVSGITEANALIKTSRMAASLGIIINEEDTGGSAVIAKKGKFKGIEAEAIAFYEFLGRHDLFGAGATVFVKDNKGRIHANIYGVNIDGELGAGFDVLGDYSVFPSRTGKTQVRAGAGGRYLANDNLAEDITDAILYGEAKRVFGKALKKGSRWNALLRAEAGIPSGNYSVSGRISYGFDLGRATMPRASLSSLDLKIKEEAQQEPEEPEEPEEPRKKPRQPQPPQPPENPNPATDWDWGTGNVGGN